MIHPDVFYRFGHGLQTGFVDSGRAMIQIGDIVRTVVETNQDFHGTWSEWAVELRATVPVLAFLRSEKGHLMPRGYLMRYLTDQYDREAVFFSESLKDVLPNETMHIVGREPEPKGGS